MTLGLLVGRFGTFIRETHTPMPEPPREAAFPSQLNRLREKVAHHMIPLVLIARSDREFLDSERAVIVAHCLLVAEKAGIALDGTEAEPLGEYVDDFHPSLVQLEPVLQRLGRCPHAELAELLNAAQAVIAADGKVAPEEAKLLSGLQAELAALAGA